MSLIPYLCLCVVAPMPHRMPLTSLSSRRRLRVLCIVLCIVRCAAMLILFFFAFAVCSLLNVCALWSSRGHLVVEARTAGRGEEAGQRTRCTPSILTQAAGISFCLSAGRDNLVVRGLGRAFLCLSVYLGGGSGPTNSQNTPPPSSRCRRSHPGGHGDAAGLVYGGATHHARVPDELHAHHRRLLARARLALLALLQHAPRLRQAAGATPGPWCCCVWRRVWCCVWCCVWRSLTRLWAPARKRSGPG